MRRRSTPTLLSPKIVRRNIGFSAANHFFVEAGMTLSQPSMVLTLFVNALGGSNFLVGLIPSLRFAAWLVPQFFAAGWMQRLRRYLPLVRALEITRGVLYLLIATLAVYLGVTHPQIVLGIFLVLFTITRVAAGTSAVARSEIVARMVPPKDRATVLALRSLFGGVAGLLSGIAVSAILSDRFSRFPLNYGLLIGISGLAFLIGIALLNRVVEPEVDFEPKPVDVGAQVRRAPQLLKGDRRYALYVATRAAGTGAEMATPFYMLFAIKVLGAPDSIAGLYIALGTFARIASNILWGKLCTSKGNLWVMKAGLACQFLSTALAALVALGATTFWQGDLPAWSLVIFASVFLVQGLGNAAGGISQVSYLYDIAPEQDRPTYYGLANTLLGPLYFLPALGGALLDSVGYLGVFGMGAVAILAARGLASQLNGYEPRSTQPTAADYSA